MKTAVLAFMTALLLLSGVAYGAPPTISAVADTVQDGQVVTITGANFGGSGPVVVIFDNFQDETADAVIDLTPTIGTWTGRETAGHTAYARDDDADGYSGNIVFDSLPEEHTIYGKHYMIFTGTEDFYVTYKMKVPRGWRWPVANGTESFTSRNSDASGSHAKLFWIWDEQTGYKECPWDTDYYLPGAAPTILVTGNCPAVTNAPSNAWWGWNAWNTWSSWFNAGTPADLANGYVWHRGMSSATAQYTGETSNVKIYGTQAEHANGDGIPKMTRFSWLGYTHTALVDGVQPTDNTIDSLWFDDLYFATGDSCAARVEIGDDETYTSCTKLDISTPTAWADGEITATIRLTQFGDGDSAYLFVVNPRNVPNAVGKAVIIGQEEAAGAATAPTAITATDGH